MYGVHRLSVLLLALVALVVAWVLVRADQDPSSKINLSDLIIGEDGTVSRSAFVLLASFGATTWVLIFMTVEHRLDFAIYGAYLAAWVTPAVTKLIVNANVETAKLRGPTPPPAASVVTNAANVQVAPAPTPKPPIKKRKGD